MFETATKLHYSQTEYKETKALEDADLLIAKVYGNGRADDDRVAYVFNVTKLAEYVPTVKTVAAQ